MMRIGLTGGIGSGKSTVSDFFRKKGAYILDLDRIAHEVEEPGGAAWQGIVEHFGREILTPDGTIDREALGAIVFRDNKKRDELNRIVHPAVFDAWMRGFAEIERENREAIIISDIPLLIEVGWHEAMDVVILVYAPPDVQIERIMKRNGYTREEACDRLSSQMPIADKIPFADFVIRNKGTLAETEKAVEAVWNELMKRSKK